MFTVVNYHTEGSRAWPLTPLAWEPFCNGSSETNYLMICLSEQIFLTSAHQSEVISFIICSLLIRKNIIDVANGSIIILSYICSYKEISLIICSCTEISLMVQNVFVIILSIFFCNQVKQNIITKLAFQVLGLEEGDMGEADYHPLPHHHHNNLHIHNK